MIKWINRVIKKKQNLSFNEKFRLFQALLSANDEAHKAMNELIELIVLGRPFSNGHALKLYSALLFQAEEMASRLMEMSRGNYTLLKFKIKEIREICDSAIFKDSFSSISSVLEIAFDSHPEKASNSYYMIDELNDTYYLETGGKMSRLAELKNSLKAPVPDGFCLTSAFFRDILMQDGLQDKIDDILDNIDFENISQIQEASQKIQALFYDLQLSNSAKELIMEAFDRTFKADSNIRVSVRSSALGEDSEKYSFAGLHRSKLNVGRKGIVDACIQVLASKYAPQSIVYRFLSGLRDNDMPMSIGCVRMINAKAGGVLFTRDPNRRKEGIIIQGVWGLGSAVVDGLFPTQEFLADRKGNISGFKPGNQTYMQALHQDSGITNVPLKVEYAAKPCLTDEQVKELSLYAILIEKKYRCPQDIEWAVDENGKVYILQARPLSIREKSRNNILEEGPLEGFDNKYPLLLAEAECASAGAASGRIRRINNPGDLAKVKKGEIILTKKNIPEFASIIHKISGIITEMGSSTGHMAIIAKEMNVPAVINTGDNLSMLEDGMEITLYADKGRIYSGRINEIVERFALSEEDQKSFRKTPVYEIWHSLTPHIFKLHLLDPDSPKFSPEFCSTLHDIARFCHETAMKIMFSLYENPDVEEAKAYDLRFDIPLEIRLIDLGGALKALPGKNYVTPWDIQNSLFHALYSGMMTQGIQWSGYIDMDTKGFANIILGNLVDQSRSSILGQKSYLLLSSNYLNFFSRLGYHFSRLDALGGEEINKNYINFNFRGGAADLTRRSRRAKVIGKILERLGFSVKISDDNVVGAIRKLPADEINKLISQLGRLMGAVRNTDITMVNEEYMEEFIRLFLEGDPAPAQTIKAMKQKLS